MSQAPTTDLVDTDLDTVHRTDLGKTLRSSKSMKEETA
jgi:hypothetical protein